MAEDRRTWPAEVLALCPRAADRMRLREIFCGGRVNLHESATWREGTEKLRRCRPQIVICEATLPDADWREVLWRTASLEAAPRIIVVSQHADESLWAEVLNLGGYDVLPMPLVEDEVVRVVGLAWQNWKNERDRENRQAEAAASLV